MSAIWSGTRDPGGIVVIDSRVGGGRLHRHQLLLRAAIVAAGVGTAAIVGSATATAEDGADGAAPSAPAASAPASPDTKPSESSGPRESGVTQESNDSRESSVSDDAQGSADSADSTHAAAADAEDAPEPIDVPEVKAARTAKVTEVARIADVARIAEPAEVPEAAGTVEVARVATPAPSPAAAAAPAPTSTAPIDYGAGSGARVAVLAGAFGSPTAVMKQLQGSVCASPNTCDPIYYFAVGDFLGPLFGRWSIDDGVSKLNAWIRATPGPKIAMGHSFGAVVITSWLRRYGSDPTAPSPAELSFITLASPENRSSAYAYTGRSTMFDYRIQDGLGIPVDTRYRVVDTCRKWDGWCDWHPAAVSTSQWGMWWLHTDYANIDLNGPANDVVVKGNVTYVLVPTPGWP